MATFLVISLNFREPHHPFYLTIDATGDASFDAQWGIQQENHPGYGVGANPRVRHDPHRVPIQTVYATRLRHPAYA